MADITLKLIWYRLSQTYSKMAAAASTWYTDLDFDSYVLDLLLFAWCAGAAIVVLSVNSIKNALGPATKQPAVERFRDYASSGDGALASVPARGQQPETCHWFNTVVGWLYLHYYHSPVYLDEWIKSLNEQLNKLGGPVQNRVESVQQGSQPPKILTITCQVTQDGAMVLLAKVESKDLLLSVFASQECSEGVRLTNCVAHVLKLNGTLRVRTFCDKKDVKLRTGFESQPEVKVEVNPTNPYQDPTTLADLGVVEQNVRNALALATTTLTITKLLMPGDLTTVPGRVPEEDTRPAKPGEVRVRASDAGWGMSAHDIALLNQRFTAQNLQNQMAQLASSIQQPSLSAQAPVVQQVPPQSRPQPVQHHVTVQKSPEVIQSISVHPVRHHQAQHVQSSPPLPQVGQSPPQAQQRSVGTAGTGQSLFEPISPSHHQSAFTSPTVGAPLKPPRMVGDKRLYVKVIKGNSLTLPKRGTVNAVCYISTDEPVQSYTSTVVKNTANPFWDEHFLFDVTHDTREVRFEVYDKSSNERGEEYIGESTIFMEDLKKTPSSRQILRLQSQPGSFDYSTGTITAEFLFMEPAEADSLLNSMTPSVSQLSPRRRIEVSQVVTPGGTRVTTTTTTTQKPQYGRAEAGYNTAPNYVEKRVPAEMDASYNAERLTPNPADSSAGQYLGRQIPTIESSPTEESPDSALSSQTSPERQAARGVTPETEKKKTSFWKRFGRKKRSYSADRSSSSQREGTHLQPPQPQYGQQSKDDLELVRPQEPGSPNLKKSRSLGGSLKKLFRRGRKSRSRARDGDTSRESSMSRGSGRNPASRDGSLNRQSAQNRASSVS
ncbi:uncharacterized protein LOC143277304 isoform X2 [Babylonia areolata]|uniref:uncharacterized protein LOC143277304 isoform X2 n=1 Tax=Babylonia areolata TaxID=304850 RepID=UPI003FD4BA59